MRSFNKLANLHRVFFKRAEGTLPRQFKGLEGFPLPGGPPKVGPGHPLYRPAPGPAAAGPPMKFKDNAAMMQASKYSDLSARAPKATVVGARSVMDSNRPNEVDPRTTPNTLPPGTDALSYYRNMPAKPSTPTAADPRTTPGY